VYTVDGTAFCRKSSAQKKNVYSLMTQTFLFELIRVSSFVDHAITPSGIPALPTIDAVHGTSSVVNVV
jgi:hypothetical protein